MQSPELARTMLFQFPPAVQPVAGYEHAIAPGVVAFVSNNCALLTGTTSKQFPSVMDKSCAGRDELGSPLL